VRDTLDLNQKLYAHKSICYDNNYFQIKKFKSATELLLMSIQTINIIHA